MEIEIESITQRIGGSHPEGRYVTTVNDTSNIRMAIYGDSFGDGGEYKTAGVVNIGNWWPNVLANRLQINSIDNYCAGGTPFVFAYNSFINNYKNYEINIVLVTEPGRYTDMIHLPSVSPNPAYYGSSMTQINSLIERYKFSAREQRTLDELKSWHVMKDLDFLGVVQNLMVEDILRRSPKTIIIPCFKTSAPFINVGLQDLQAYQLQSLGIKDDQQMAKYVEKPEVIGCHFTPEMNRVVADMVFNRIVTGEFNWNFPKIKHEHPLEYYYEKKEN